MLRLLTAAGSVVCFKYLLYRSHGLCLRATVRAHETCSLVSTIKHVPDGLSLLIFKTDVALLQYLNHADIGMTDDISTSVRNAVNVDRHIPAPFSYAILCMRILLILGINYFESTIGYYRLKRCFALFLMLAEFCTILRQTYSSSQSLLTVVVGSARESERVCVPWRIYLVN